MTDDQIRERIRHNFESARHLAGISYAEWIRRAKVPARTFFAARTGQSLPTVNVAIKIAAGAGLKAEHLWGFMTDL